LGVKQGIDNLAARRMKARLEDLINQKSSLIELTKA
jgi:hypothetical protein